MHRLADMAKSKKTSENLYELVRLEFDEQLTLAECAARLQIADRTIYDWRDSDEYKVALAEYVDELEQEAVPRALALLVKLVKRGDRKAAAELMRIYKGVKVKAEGVFTVEHLIREVLNGSNGRKSPDES